jgi:hypothetical protein
MSFKVALPVQLVEGLTMPDSLWDQTNKESMESERVALGKLNSWYSFWLVEFEA